MLDMQASPYDLRELGYPAVPIETSEGKATYLEAQRAFAERSNALRRRLIDVLRGVETTATGCPGADAAVPSEGPRAHRVPACEPGGPPGTTTCRHQPARLVTSWSTWVGVPHPL